MILRAVLAQPVSVVSWVLRLLRLWGLMLMLVLALPGIALAQNSATSSPPDYAAWEKVATAAEATVQTGTADSATLDNLRSKVDVWRKQLTAAEDTNASQITTVKAQIDALGPVPKEGESEDQAIASRRKTLNDQLAQLQAPGLRAAEAASRADVIVANIDKLVRARQTDKLLRLTPTPLNPVNWPDALKITGALTGALASELDTKLSADAPYAKMRDNAPVIVGLVLVALLLLVRGRRWIERLAEVLENKLALRARRVIEALVSLGQLFLPLVGVSILILALRQTALLGPLWVEFLGVLGTTAATIIAAVWLAGRIFPKSEQLEAPFNLMSERRCEGRILTVTLGLLVGLQGPLGDWVVKRGEQVLNAIAKTSEQTDALARTLDAGFSVLAFPLQVLAGVFLFRLGQLMRRHLRNEASDSEEKAFRDRIVGAIGNLVIAVAVLGPVLGAIGYVNAANAMIWPLVLTLALIALVLVTQQFFADLYVFVTRRDDDARESLIPVLIGFALGMLALPVAALIWGARVDDLKELWGTFQSGATVGGVKISPGVFLTFLIIFVIGLSVTRLVQGALRTSLLPKTKIDKGGQSAIVSGIGYVGIFLAAVIAISSAGIDLSSLAIVAGALSVGVGFGLQTIVQNFVSGIILLIERPISEGDWIEVGTQQGIVKAITVRSTRIETFDRSEVIVPNADLISGQVTNWTRANVTGRLIVPVGVAYGTDTRKVEKILLEVAQNQPLIMMNPEPYVLFVAFGASSLDFEVRAILSDVNFKLRVMSEMNHEINARFAVAGIEVPFPQSDLWLRNPEVLRDVGCREADKPEATPKQGASKENTPEKHASRTDLGQPLPGEGIEDVDGDGDGG
ncbi:MAG: mechanosensitive ion channel family protein, partial [Rhodobacteraceae bacterium]|nr:mechanosensitive ion channel family protein [Paracoccaceae bacterium]